MTHLTSDEFEDILRGAAAAPPHVDDCPTCSAKLAELRAIQDRLRIAFGALKPEPTFAERLRERVRLSMVQPGHAPAAKPDARPRLLRFARPWWTASIAALVLIVVGLVFFFGQPEPAMADRTQLVRIYENSLCQCGLCGCAEEGRGCAKDDKDTCRESDPQKLSEFMQKRFGFVPIFPDLKGEVLRGGCAGSFRQQAVAAYVLQKGEQPITVVAIPHRPETLGLSQRFRYMNREFWACEAKGCNMVAVRLGQHTYCAVGKTDRHLLTEILGELVKGELVLRAEP